MTNPPPIEPEVQAKLIEAMAISVITSIETFNHVTFAQAITALATALGALCQASPNPQVAKLLAMQAIEFGLK